MTFMKLAPTPCRVVVLGLLALAPVLATSSQAEPKARRKPDPAAKPAAPAPPPVLPDPPLPVRQAQAIGLGQCAPVLDLMSRQTLTSTYDIQSGWFRADPAHHVFQSVAALTTPANTPPDGFAALIASPLASGGCDGVAVQVFPLAVECQEAQRTMLKDGHVLAPLVNARIMVDGRGNRVVLLPASNQTCIAISVESRFGPAAPVAAPPPAAPAGSAQSR